MSEQACGRPTRAGSPCRAMRPSGRRACTVHETPEDQAYAEGWHDGWRAYVKDFDDNARQWALQQRGYEITTAERKLDELRMHLERLLGVRVPD